MGVTYGARAQSVISHGTMVQLSSMLDGRLGKQIDSQGYIIARRNVNFNACFMIYLRKYNAAIPGSVHHVSHVRDAFLPLHPNIYLSHPKSVDRRRTRIAKISALKYDSPGRRGGGGEGGRGEEAWTRGRLYNEL